MQLVGVCVSVRGLYDSGGIFVCHRGAFAVVGVSVSVAVDPLQFMGVCVCGGGLYAVSGVSVSVVNYL